jgi:signal peptidase I
MMPVLTALVLGAFAAYGAAWFMGMVQGNFALLLFLATVVTGLYWIGEKLVFLPRRRLAADQLQVQADQRRRELQGMGIAQVDTDVTAAREKLLAQPWWLDWTAGLFPVIVVVFVFRSFIWEPFKIPSGSMIPTLHIGDLILVNKYHYGLRLPVLNTKITEGAPVARGDVVVFRYPPQPSTDYIKRVVGLPGDEVAYIGKRLRINGQPVSYESLPEFFDESVMRYFQQARESLGPRPHLMIEDKDRPGFVAGASEFPFRDQCRYNAEGLVCKVPAGHYFVMGDNRDNSLDSRFWGFVPDGNLVGKAFFVWMNFSNWRRIGGFD